MSLEVREPLDRGELERGLALRRAVFCDEQGIPEANVVGPRDIGATHVVAVDDGRVVGSLRLLIVGADARLGQMAVRAGRRRNGVGSAMLREAERICTAAGAAQIRLHAQVPARRVYERAGFVEVGQPFHEQEIEHVTMEKHLA